MSAGRLVEALAAHRQVPDGIRDLVRCTCSSDASYTPDKAWASHLAAVVLDLLDSDGVRTSVLAAVIGCGRTATGDTHTEAALHAIRTYLTE